MNKIVREHYPVSQLPDDLRVGLDPSTDVRIVVEQETRIDPASSDSSDNNSPSQRSIADILGQARRLREVGIITPISEAEAVERVRRLRDG